MSHHHKINSHPADSQLPAKSLVAAALLPNSYDDMRDTPEELSHFQALAPALKLCTKIDPPYRDADRLAMIYQNRHRRITWWAALLGTLAVGFAILGLSHGHEEFWARLGIRNKEFLDYFELFFAGTAVSIVLIGWFSNCKDNWLSWRHKAESYRLLRYELLIHPSIWMKSNADAQAWIDAKIEKINTTSLDSAVQEPSPHGPFEGTQMQLPAATLRALTEYYLFKRLNPQKDYLANRMTKNELADWIRSYLPLFFFVSIVVVLFKFFFRHHSETLEGFLAFLAALLPAAAAGVRTWRSAFEFSRNKGRFEAAHGALGDLGNRLVNEAFSTIDEKNAVPSDSTGRSYVQPILRDLCWCEHILETEHREWLRLMYDTEWFG